MAGRPKGGPKFGGRVKGTPNKATAEIRELARVHGPRVVAELARLAFNAVSEPTRVAACRELLDRGYGKSVQPLDGDGEGGAINHTIEVEFVSAREQLARKLADLTSRMCAAPAEPMAAAAATENGEA